MMNAGIRAAFLLVAMFLISSCNLIFFKDRAVTIAISPSFGTLQPGTSIRLQAFRTNPGGASENVTGSVAWLSSNSEVLSVSAGGYVDAIAPGSASIGATLSGLSDVAVITVIDPTTTPSPPGGSTSFVANPGFEDPDYIDYPDPFDPGAIVKDNIPDWKLDIGGADGIFNIGINTFDDKDAGSNYLYLGQENALNESVVTMVARAETAISVDGDTRFQMRFKAVDFEGRSNHSDFEYPVRVIVTVSGVDCYLFLRSTNAVNANEQVDKAKWEVVEIGLQNLILATVDSRETYQVLPGDKITGIRIEPRGLYWKVFVDYVDIIS